MHNDKARQTTVAMITINIHDCNLSLCPQVVQEYERAVIFRLGRLPAGGSKGPGRG